MLHGQALRERDGRTASRIARCRSSAAAATCARTSPSASSASCAWIGSGRARPRSSATSSPTSSASAASSACSADRPRRPVSRSRAVPPTRYHGPSPRRWPPDRPRCTTVHRIGVTGAPEGSGDRRGVWNTSSVGTSRDQDDGHMIGTGRSPAVHRWMRPWTKERRRSETWIRSASVSSAPTRRPTVAWPRSGSRCRTAIAPPNSAVIRVLRGAGAPEPARGRRRVVLGRPRRRATPRSRDEGLRRRHPAARVRHLRRRGRRGRRRVRPRVTDPGRRRAAHGPHRSFAEPALGAGGADGGSPTCWSP